MLKLCSYGRWSELENSIIEDDGEWVRQEAFLRRECRYCGRREEKKASEGWQGYHISAEFEESSDGETSPDCQAKDETLSKDESGYELKEAVPADELEAPDTVEKPRSNSADIPSLKSPDCDRREQQRN